jgi:hypothetical protein
MHHTVFTPSLYLISRVLSNASASGGLTAKNPAAVKRQDFFCLYVFRFLFMETLI